MQQQELASPMIASCSEVSKRESKGGLVYDLLLEDVPKGFVTSGTSSPTTTTTPGKNPPILTPSKQVIRSADEIAEKLRAAESRRQSIELAKISSSKGKDAHIEILSKKRDEVEQRFKESARQSYGRKMEGYKENRENYIKSIQDKSRDHVAAVMETKRRHSIDDSQAKQLSQRLAKKLETAAEARASLIQNLKDRLKEHEKHVMDVRSQIENQTEELMQKLTDKLDKATEKRDSLRQELQAKLHEHDAHIEEVRLNALRVQEQQQSAAAAVTAGTRDQ